MPSNDPSYGTISQIERIPQQEETRLDLVNGTTGDGEWVVRPAHSRESKANKENYKIFGRHILEQSRQSQDNIGGVNYLGSR